MSDNIIPKKDAIDRMRDGLPCETLVPHETNWRATLWSDFSFGGLQFRIPPEPRMEAREWERVTHIYTDGRDELIRHVVREPGHIGIHVREVLPGEVVLRRMTREQAKQKLRDTGLGNEADLCAGMAAFDALGLIEDNKP